ncbi:MAG: hypothetical protein HGB18_00180 [Candidatus Moranbacteria bacterium]|nr:hypothetical protein [Candidatus Moranbacteria bacterium]
MTKRGWSDIARRVDALRLALFIRVLVLGFVDRMRHGDLPRLEGFRKFVASVRDGLRGPVGRVYENQTLFLYECRRFAQSLSVTHGSRSVA